MDALNLRQNGVPRRSWGWTSFLRRLLHGVPPTTPSVAALEILGGTHISGAPFLVPESFFSIGGVVEGAPGTGKTVACTTVLQQRIRLARDYPRSFVYVDLKADVNSNEVYHALRIAAEQAGIPFRAIVIGDTAFQRPTSACNLMAMEFWRRADLETQANFLCSSLGLEYGMDYGPHFFSSMISYLADYTLKRFPHACTYRQLYRAVSQLISAPARQRPRDLHRDYIDKALVFHSALSHLSRYDCLNVAPDSGHPLDVVDNRIDFADLFRTPQVVYFFINKAVGGSAAAEAGRQIPFGLQYTSQLCPREIPVTLVIDEVPTIASHPLRDGLNQLRGMDVGLVYILQSIDDLQTNAVDLRPNVKNLSMYWKFSINDEEEQMKFSKNSGYTAALLGSMTGQPTMAGLFAVESFTLREELLPFCELNTVKAVSANPELSFVTITRDVPDCRFNGLSFIVRRIPRHDLGKIARAPWVEQLGTFVPAKREEVPNPELPDLAGPVPPLAVNGRRPRHFEIHSSYKDS